MKQCSKCKEWKDESEFGNHKTRKDGLRGECKECENQRNKKYKENNKELVREQKRRNTRNNREKKNQRDKRYMKYPLKFNSQSKDRKEIELYEEIKESINGNVEVKCANCENWFEPNKRQIQKRLESINGESQGENKLYCSEKCKENCPVFRQHYYPKQQKPYPKKDQLELRQIVLEKNEYTCIQCGKCTDGKGLICHHIEPVVCNPIESADTDNCIVLCEDCHDEAHNQTGCRLHELKRIKEKM